MRKLIIALFCSISLHAQVVNKTDNVTATTDTLVIDNGQRDSLKIFKPSIADYRYKTQYGDEKVFDTTFALQKAYELTQYNHEDNFSRIQFNNIGSGFQDLAYKYYPKQNMLVMPTRKSYFITPKEEVKYYDVKTPTTSFIYNSAMRNGASLQSTYTQNFGRKFNFAVQYTGLRSEGFYTNNLAANNSLIFSGRFKSDNGKYEAYAHFLHQNVNNEENGGIKDLDIFLGGDSRFKNRQNLQVNLNNSNSRYSYRRYYLSQSFAPFNPERIPFKLEHTIYHQGNKYYFLVPSQDATYFGEIISGRNSDSRKYSNTLSNTVSLLFDREKFKLKAGVLYEQIELGAENKLTESSEIIGTKWKDNRIGAVGNLRIRLWDKVDLDSDLEYSTGDVFGNYISLQNNFQVEPIEGYFLDGKVNFKSSAPSFNYLVNVSPISGYDYEFNDFSNESILELGAAIGLKWLDANALVNYFRIDNYAYFGSDSKPVQSNTSLNITQIGGEATLSHNKFHLNARLLFQKSLSGEELYPMPSVIGRATLYYQSKAFKNAADLMGGLKVYYFSQFDSREYSPMLNEFILPGSRGYAIGGEPIVDAFINMKVKTMQIFIEGQNLTASFMQNKSYTAPYHPLYDFRLNIGIVWNLFH